MFNRFRKNKELTDAEFSAKGLSGYVVKSAQGHGLDEKSSIRAQEAAQRGMERVGMTSILPRPFTPNIDEDKSV